VPFYSGDCISALRGCCALKFLHALQIDQGYLAHIPTGTGFPPKNFNRENLKFGLKFSVYTSITSGLIGISSQIFIQTTCRESGVIIWVQFWEGLPTKIWDGKKTSKIFSISDNFRLWLRISPERIHKSKMEKVDDQLRPLPCWKKETRWTLVHKLKSYWREYWPTEVPFHSGDCISALRECCALIFFHALEIDQGYLAYTPTGTGVPPKNFNRENLKFGLKFSIYTSITSGLMGISQIFIQTTCREPGVITWVQFLIFRRLAP